MLHNVADFIPSTRWHILPWQPSHVTISQRKRSDPSFSITRTLSHPLALDMLLAHRHIASARPHRGYLALRSHLKKGTWVHDVGTRTYAEEAGRSVPASGKKTHLPRQSETHNDHPKKWQHRPLLRPRSLWSQRDPSQSPENTVSSTSTGPPSHDEPPLQHSQAPPQSRPHTMHLNPFSARDNDISAESRARDRQFADACYAEARLQFRQLADRLPPFPPFSDRKKFTRFLDHVHSLQQHVHEMTKVKTWSSRLTTFAPLGEVSLLRRLSRLFTFVAASLSMHGFILPLGRILIFLGRSMVNEDSHWK